MEMLLTGLRPDHLRAALGEWTQHVGGFEDLSTGSCHQFTNFVIRFIEPAIGFLSNAQSPEHPALHSQEGCPTREHDHRADARHAKDFANRLFLGLWRQVSHQPKRHHRIDRIGSEWETLDVPGGGADELARAAQLMRMKP